MLKPGPDRPGHPNHPNDTDGLITGDHTTRPRLGWGWPRSSVAAYAEPGEHKPIRYWSWRRAEWRLIDDSLAFLACFLAPHTLHARL